MVSFEDGKPIIKNSDYGFIKYLDSVKFVFVDKPVTKNLILTGHTKEIHKVIDKKGWYFDWDAVRNGLVNLIKLEINKDSTSVGFPIYTITLSKDNNCKWDKHTH